MRIAKILLCVLLLSACGKSDDNKGPIPENPVDEQGSVIGRILNEVIQERFKTLYTYQKVIQTLGQAGPFLEAARDEAENAEKLKTLFNAFDLETPESLWSLSNVPVFSTLEEACQAGVKNEQESIETYNNLLNQPLPPDIKNIFEDLKKTSETKHLPAFQNCQ